MTYAYDSAGRHRWPICNASAADSDSHCQFPVSEPGDRCYRHDPDAPSISADPVAFLHERDVPVTEAICEVVADIPEQDVPLVVDVYVREVHKTGQPAVATALARLEQRELALTRTFQDGVVDTESTESGEAPPEVRPGVRTFFQVRKQRRQLRRAAGLTVHAEPDLTPILDEWLWEHDEE